MDDFKRKNDEILTPSDGNVHKTTDGEKTSIDERLERLTRESSVFIDEHHEDSKIEEATKEKPFKFAKRAASVLLAGFWVVGIIFLFTGGDFIIPFVMTLICLAAILLFNIPDFMNKNKKGDVVIAVIAAAVCIITAVTLFLSNAQLI